MRKSVAPPTHTNTVALEDFPVEHRWARFLNNSGQTCVDVYWALGARAYHLRSRYVRRLRREGHRPSDRFLLSAAVVQRDVEHIPVSMTDNIQLVQPDTSYRSSANTMSTCLERRTSYLVMQWLLQWTTGDSGDSLRLGAALKMRTASVDSIVRLNRQGALDMSDLRPLVEDPSTGSLTVYPWASLPLAQPLTLQFDIYNLTYGAEDATHYSIAYRITSGEANRRSVTSRYTGQERNANESVTLDWTAMSNAGHIDIEVQLVDEVTGSSVKRSIAFQLDDRIQR